MKRNFLYFVNLLLVVGLSSVVALAAPVRIAGRVLNGTHKDVAAAGVTVKLVTMPMGAPEPKTLATVKTDARGFFAAKPLELGENDLVFARIDWDGYPYVNAAYTGKVHGQESTLDPSKLVLRVFDTTKVAPQGLNFTVHHVAIKSEGSSLKCIERMVVENPSNRTYIGGDKEQVTLGLSLPAGATDVHIGGQMPDAKLVKTGKVYGVSKPLVPAGAEGRNVVVVEYSLPWSGKGIDLSRSLLYPVKFFFVAREEVDSKLIVTAPELGKDERQELPLEGGTQTRIVNAVGQPMNPQPALKAGTKIAINVSRPANPMIWAFVALVGALFLAVPFTLMKTRGARAGGSAQSDIKIAEPTEGGSVNGSIPGAGTTAVNALTAGASNGVATGDAQQWVEKIAQLDDDWEAGRIPREEYQTKRAEWKQKVVELLASGSTSR